MSVAYVSNTSWLDLEYTLHPKDAFASKIQLS